MAAYFDGRIDESSRETLERHFSDCDACLGQLGLLATAASTPAAPVPAPLLNRAAAVKGRTSRVPLFGWAAAAVLFVAGGVWLTQQAGGPPLAVPASSEVRGVDATEVVVVQPRDEAVLVREAADVQWEPVARVLYYEVRLAAVDGALLWESRTEKTAITIPADALRPGARGFIWITAQLPDNRSVRSPARAISIPAR